MADTAAHLVDRVFPEVPVRQWVLSLPFALRYRLAYDSSLVRDVLQVFVRTIFASIRRRAGIPASNRQARCGSVSFVQRFGDALNLNLHFHTMALDGVYLVDEDGAIAFRHVALPSDAEVARVTDRIRRRVSRLLERRGLRPNGGLEEADPLQHDQPLLAELYGASISGLVAIGPRAGRRIAKVGDMIDVDGQAPPAGPRYASIAGFSVHANVCVPAHDHMRLERLFRYAGRPPVATDRLAGNSWKHGCCPRNYSWSELAKRIFAIDALECPRCGARMRILCAIHPPDAIRKILECLGIPSRPPPVASAFPVAEDPYPW